MIKNMEFKIQIDPTYVSVYDETDFIKNNTSSLKDKAIEQVTMSLNIEYAIDLDARSYGIKDLTMTAYKIIGIAFIEYYADKSDELTDVDQEYDLSEFTVVFEKAVFDGDTTGGMSVYPSSAEIFFDKKRIELQY
jgi:hypothetical protein